MLCIVLLKHSNGQCTFLRPLKNRARGTGPLAPPPYGMALLILLYCIEHIKPQYLLNAYYRVCVRVRGTVISITDVLRCRCICICTYININKWRCGTLHIFILVATCRSDCKISLGLSNDKTKSSVHIYPFIIILYWYKTHFYVCYYILLYLRTVLCSKLKHI